MIETSRPNSRNWIVGASLFAILLPTIVVAAALAYRSTLPYQINYNEGWNTYFVERVRQGLALYPPPQASIINNYPPLSFYLVAAVSALVGKIWIAGRLVAWVSFLACAALIWAILRTMKCGALAAAFGASLFAAIMVTRYDLYVGMFDPQMTANALMLGGLLVLLRGEARATRATVVAALLMVAGGFVKHNLLALPLAVTLWLASFRRSLLLVWLIAGVVCVAIGMAAVYLAYGHNFFAGITAARQFLFQNGYTKMVNWMVPIEVPVAIAVLPLFRNHRDANAVLIAFYVVAAIAVGVLGAAGDGVNYNIVFDVAIAAALGVGYAIGGKDGNPAAGWIAVACAGAFVLSTAQVARAQSTSLRAWLAQESGRVDEARRVVSLLATHPGPALCGDLLLCQMAGKPFEYDPFNNRQAVLVGKRSDDALLAEIDRQHFAAIQVSKDNNQLSPALLDAVHAHYAPVPGLPSMFVPAAPKDQGQ
jgi:hypothetical protein